MEEEADTMDTREPSVESLSPQDSSAQSPSGVCLQAAADYVKTMLGHPVCQLVKSLKELWGLLIFVALVVTPPLTGPALDVRYHIEPFYPPVTMACSTDPNNAGSSEAASQTSAFLPLPNSRSLLYLSIRNNSKETLKDFDLQINAYSISGVGFNSNSSQLMRNRTELAAFEVGNDFVARFPNLTTIPAKAEVDLVVWGDFALRFFRSTVRVQSSAANVCVRREGTVSGLGLWVARRLGALTFIVAVLLLLLGLRRYGRARWKV